MDCLVAKINITATCPIHTHRKKYVEPVRMISARIILSGVIVLPIPNEFRQRNCCPLIRTLRSFFFESQPKRKVYVTHISL